MKTKTGVELNTKVIELLVVVALLFLHIGYGLSTWANMDRFSFLNIMSILLLVLVILVHVKPQMVPTDTEKSL